MATATNQQFLVAVQIASTNLNFQIPPISIKLDCQNYSLWRTTIVSVLECFDLDSFILNPAPPPETITLTAPALQAVDAPPVVPDPVPNPDFVAWKKKDRFVLLWINSTLFDNLFPPLLDPPPLNGLANT